MNNNTNYRQDINQKLFGYNPSSAVRFTSTINTNIRYKKLTLRYLNTINKIKTIISTNNNKNAIYTAWIEYVLTLYSLFLNLCSFLFDFSPSSLRVQLTSENCC